MPSACEVDVMGAISMYALALAAERAVGDPRLEQQLRPRGRQVRLHALRQLPQELHRRRRRRSRELDVLGTRARQGEMLRRGQGQGEGGADDVLPRLDRRPARDRQGLCRRGRLHRRSLRHGRRHRRDPGGAAAPAARLRRPQRLRASRRDGARPSRRAPSTRRSRAISAGRPTATRPKPAATPTLLRVQR